MSISVEEIAIDVKYLVDSLISQHDTKYDRLLLEVKEMKREFIHAIDEARVILLEHKDNALTANAIECEGYLRALLSMQVGFNRTFDSFIKEDETPHDDQN